MVLSKEIQQKIIELHAQGLLPGQISEKLDKKVHHVTIAHYIRKFQTVPLNSKNENEEEEESIMPLKTTTTTSVDPLVEMEKARKLEMINDSVELRNKKIEAQIRRDDADAERQRVDMERQKLEIERMRQQYSQPLQVQQPQPVQQKESEDEMIKLVKEMNKLKMISKMFNNDSETSPQIQMLMQQINDLKTELKSKDRDNSFMEAMKMNQSNMVNPERWLESQERLSEKHLQLIAERQKMEIDRLRDELKLIAGQRQSEDALGNSLSKKIGEYIEKNMDVAKVLGKDEGEKSLINDPEFIKTLVQGGVGLMSAMGQRKQQNEYQPPQPQEYVQPVTPVRPAGAYQAQQRVLKPEPNGHSIKSQKFEDINFMRPVDYDNTDLNNQNTDLSGFEHNFLNENPS